MGRGSRLWVFLFLGARIGDRGGVKGKGTVGERGEKREEEEEGGGGTEAQRKAVVGSAIFVPAGRGRFALRRASREEGRSITSSAQGATS